jgi:RNA polymerase sigma-70 factor (ECF subfamily)
MTIVRWIAPLTRMKGVVTGAEPMPSVSTEAGLTLREVHERHADFVWRTLQRLGVRSMDLEDQMQEVFIVTHRRLGSFDGASALKTWLFAICLRVAAAHRRRAHVRRELAASDGEERLVDETDEDPERAAIQREAHEELERLLATLDLEKRAVFVMFEIEGMTAPEIASVMGTPVGTVYSRLAAARAELTQAAARTRRRERRFV